MTFKGLTYDIVPGKPGYLRCVYKYKKDSGTYPAGIEIVFSVDADKALVYIQGLTTPIKANDLEHAKQITRSILSLI